MYAGGQQYGKADNTIYNNGMPERSAQMTPVGSPTNSYHQGGYNMPNGGQPMMNYGGQPMMNQGGYGSPGAMAPGYGNPGMMPPTYPGMANPNMPPAYGGPGPNGNPFQGGGFAGLAGLLNSLPHGLYVKQKPDYLEQMTGCDRQNEYKVYNSDNSGKQAGHEILYCRETSGYCDRACASAECRGIEIDIRRVDTEEVVLRLQRECQCTCCCCNRPEMKVFLTENGQNTYLGKVMDPYDCCNYSFKVLDQSDNVKFVVEADCCQLGLCCQGCPCEPCEKVIFNLWRGDKQIPDQPLVKLGKGDFVKNVLTTADNFSLPFPTNSTWQDKALLLALVIMIDYLMFEKSSNSGPSHNKGYSSF